MAFSPTITDATHALALTAVSASILRLGHRQRNVKWTRTLLEQWLVAMCSAMGYTAYTPYQMETTRQKMRHAIALAYQQNIYPPQPQRAVYAH